MPYTWVCVPLSHFSDALQCNTVIRDPNLQLRMACTADCCPHRLFCTIESDHEIYRVVAFACGNFGCRHLAVLRDVSSRL